jgi:DNA-binding Lrp family transcriptional regulator
LRGEKQVVESYTLARIKPSKDLDAYNKIKELKEVKDVVTTYGEYDIIIKIEVETLDELDDFVFNKLRTINGVEATTTLISARYPR